MIKTYSYTDNTQLSPHFNAREFRCKCGKEHDFQIDDDLITKLEQSYLSGPADPRLYGLPNIVRADAIRESASCDGVRSGTVTVLSLSWAFSRGQHSSMNNMTSLFIRFQLFFQSPEVSSWHRYTCYGNNSSARTGFPLRGLPRNG